MDDTQWTEQAHTRFRAAADEFADAIRAHCQILSALTGRQSDFQRLFQADTALAQAAANYADAQFEFTGTFPPLGLVDDDQEEEQDSGDVDSKAAVARVSVLHRADYRVTDPEVVVAAGRSAYRKLWPDESEEDAVADVDHLGRAFYQIQHLGGVSSLSQIGGMEMAGSTTWILKADQLLDDMKSDEWPANPFELGDDPTERLLLVFDETNG